MRLLLDTHIWLWSVLERERLTARVRAALADPDTELWVSPISTWELLLLVERGRYGRLAGVPPGRAAEDALAAGPFREASITHAIAQASRHVALPHHDPADRFLVATARVLDLQLVTADATIIRARQCKVLPNL
ncbi:MAG: type II toxin-antitoxin system VapC family toxin [Gemmatimonadales bacterium]